MKIEKAEIGGFGKFTNYHIDFSSGIEIYYGDNENGKSTLMMFLLMMFYSDQGRGRELDQNPRKKYRPWNGAAMEGAIEFSFDGVPYHLFKRFGDTPGRDKVRLTDRQSGKEIPLSKGQEVGSFFFGLDLSGFQRSCFIGQLGRIEAVKNDLIAEKLMENLVTTGELDVSQQEVIERLSRARYDLVGKSGTIGRLVELRSQIKTCQTELEETRRTIHDQKAIQQEYDRLSTLYQRDQQIGKILEAYAAKQQEQRIHRLLLARQTIDEKTAALCTSTIGFSQVQELTTEIGTALQERETVLQNLQAFQEAITSSPATSITQEEYQIFHNACQRETQLGELCRFWQGPFLSGLARQQEQKDLYDQLSTQLQLVTSDYQQAADALRELEALETSSKLVEQTLLQKTESLLQQQMVWREQEGVRRERIRCSKDYPTGQAASGGLLQWLLSGLCLAGIFVLLAFFLEPLFAVGALALPLLLLVGWYAGRKARRNAQDASEQKTAQLEQELASWLQSVQQQEQELKHELEELKTANSSDSIRQDLRHAESCYQKLSTALGDQKLLVKEAELRLQAGRASLMEQLKPFADSPFLSPETTHSLPTVFFAQQEADRLANLLQHQTNLVVHLLEQKQLSTPEDYQNAYLRYQAEADHRQKLEELTLRCRSLQEHITHLAKAYDPSLLNFEDAVLLYHSLSDQIRQIDLLQNDLSQSAAAVGISNTSAAYLEYQYKQQQTLSTAYQGEPVDELLEEQRLLKQHDFVGELRQLQKQIQTPRRSQYEIEMELLELSRREQEMADYFSGLCTAIELMEEAQDEMRRSFSPMLNEQTAAIFAQLTEQKYETLAVDKAYGITVKSDYAYYDWRYLSGGTIDQAYLALRLAITGLIRPERGTLPLFLDDVLIQYDDHRMFRALSFLKEYAAEQGCQILLFTCRKSLCGAASQISVPVTAI